MKNERETHGSAKILSAQEQVKITRQRGYREIERGLSWAELEDVFATHNLTISEQGERFRKNPKLRYQVPISLGKFILDRVLEKPDLVNRFGWEDISLRQMASLFAAFSGIPRTEAHKLIKRDLFNLYPDYYGILDGARCPEARFGIPSWFFITTFRAQFQNHQEADQAEAAIYKASTKYGLYPAEYAVLLLTVRGFENKRIASCLGVTPDTRKDQACSGFTKIAGRVENGIKLRENVIRIALNENLVPGFFVNSLPIAYKSYRVGNLTAREQDIVRYFGLGLTNKEIARRSDVSLPHIRRLTSRIFRKLGCQSRIEAIVLNFLYESQKDALAVDKPESPELPAH